MAAQEDNEAIERLGWTEMTLTEEELTLWELSARSAIDILGDESVIPTETYFQILMLISALRKERAAKELAVECLKRYAMNIHEDWIKQNEMHKPGHAARKVLAKIAEHDGEPRGEKE